MPFAIIFGCLLALASIRDATAAERVTRIVGGTSTSAAPPASGAAAGSTLEDTFRHALMAEEYSQDLGAAVTAYREVIAGLDANRKMAATAIFRLGECYRKQGQTNEAVLQFERVRRDFSDQAQLTDLAQQRLLELAPAKALPSAGEPLKVFNPAQAQLAREELKLLEKEMAAAEQRYRNGLGGFSERIRIQQEMLSLQRQLPENRDPAKQQALIQQQIKLIESLLNEVKKKISIGAASPLETVPFEREILALRRDLAATATTTTESAAGTDEEAAEVQRIKMLIKDSPDLINALDINGPTPLHAAAAKGQLVVAQFLLDNHAEVDARDKEGATPLYRAAGQGHKSLVELLLRHGADVNATCRFKETPLFIAAERGYAAIVETLLANNAKVDPKGITYREAFSDFTPLHAAACEGFLSPFRAVSSKGFETIAEQLIAHGADVNAFSRHSGNGVDGTPLHLAANFGYADMVRLLLAHGADVNARNTTGSSPLLVAAAYNRPEIVTLLLGHGADVNAQNLNGWTSLRFAVQYEQVAIAKMLLEHHADSNLADANGWTPLDEAVRDHTDRSLVQLLLDHKADPNAKDKGGSTSLTLIANDPKKADLVELLLARGATVNLQVPGGWTPLMTAVNAQATNNVRLILGHKPNLEWRNYEGNTALQMAVMARNAAITQLLLDAGANPNVTSDRGHETPLHWAVMNRDSEIARLLLEHKANVNAQNDAGATPLQIVAQQARTRVPGQPGVPAFQGVPGSLPPAGVFPGAVPIRAVPPGMALPGAAPSTQVAPATPTAMASLLRQFGASENPYRLSQIALSRPALNEFEPTLLRGTNAFNRFTLLELLTDSPHPFPDLAHVVIHRLTTTGETNDIKVNVEAILDASDPAKDIWLQWGDVAELPVMDHLVNEQWEGYPAATLDKLRKCLQRRVQFRVKGQTNLVVILPGIVRPNSMRGRRGPFDLAAYAPLLPQIDRIDLSTLTWLGPTADRREIKFAVVDRETKERTEGGVQWLSDSSDVTHLRLYWRDPARKEPILDAVTFLRAARLAAAIRDANVVLTSSDLTRVKVKRIDPITKEPLEMIFNLDKIDPKTDLWLRDGDVVEIPERGEGSTASNTGDHRGTAIQLSDLTAAHPAF